jgi:hypothetical protein
MGRQAIVTRTGFDEEREVNKRVLNALTINT